MTSVSLISLASIKVIVSIDPRACLSCPIRGLLLTVAFVADLLQKLGCGFTPNDLNISYIFGEDCTRLFYLVVEFLRLFLARKFVAKFLAIKAFTSATLSLCCYEGPSLYQKSLALPKQGLSCHQAPNYR